MKDRAVFVRVDPETAKALEALAREENVPLSTWLRCAGIATLKCESARECARAARRRELK